MNLIKTVNELVRERMDECADVGADKFINSVRPIYGSDERENPYHIGSCVLIQVNDQKIIVTAAHVADNLNISKLYIGAKSKLVELGNEFKSTVKPYGKRGDDHYDISFLKISDSLQRDLDELSFVNEHEMCLRLDYTKGRQFLALGYPRSKNKKYFAQDRLIKSHLYKYSSVVKNDNKLCKRLGVSGDQHLFLDFNSKKSRDYNGNIVNSLNPQGISGGAMLDMGRLANPNQYKTDAQCIGRLAGIFIEHKSEFKVMVAVRINCIIDMINKYM
ncbi:trypsin-like serine protease [Desulforhopalus singaporensis]|nr:trypsin-like serine protease [Desulforhopalus singaporensis]